MMDFDNFLENFTLSNSDIFNKANYPKNKKIFKEKILTKIRDLIFEEDESNLEYLLVIANHDGLDSDYSDLISKLLQAEWHELHEDLVEYSFEIKDVKIIEFLSIVANKEFEYLDYDGTYSLAKLLYFLRKRSNIFNRYNPIIYIFFYSYTS